MSSKYTIVLAYDISKNQDMLESRQSSTHYYDECYVCLVVHVRRQGLKCEV